MTHNLVRSLGLGMIFAASLTLNGAEPGIVTSGLIVDLNADKGVVVEDGKVAAWKNQVPWKAVDFEGRRANGRPSVRKVVAALRGHDALVFEQQELVNYDEDAFDHLSARSGYTWFMVIAAHDTQPGLEKDVNSFFGNLKNGGQFEGFWGGLDDDNTLWLGSRNGKTFGRWNDDNPKVTGPKLEANRFYVIAGRMGAGAENVAIEMFVNEPKPVASKPFPINPTANASKMAIGQERDATNHPGRESFRGELARVLIWERPLTETELTQTLDALKRDYGIK